MATLDDVVTVQKNGVIAINNLGLTLKSYNEGQYTSQSVTSSTVIYVGAGRLVSMIVVSAGTSPGYIYNVSSTSNAAITNAIVPVPNLVGVYQIGAKFDTGLVVVPGTGQYVNLTYSTD